MELRACYTKRNLSPKHINQPWWCWKYLHILEWKVLYFGSEFIEVCCKGPNWQWVIIGSDNDLVLNRWQAITGRKVDWGPPCYMMSLVHNELTRVLDGFSFLQQLACAGCRGLTHWGWIHFHEQKMLYFDSYFTDICFKWSNWWCFLLIL